MAYLIIDKNMNSEFTFPIDEMQERITSNTLNASKKYDISSGNVPPLPIITSDKISTVEAFTDDNFKIPLGNSYNKIFLLSSYVDDKNHVITYNLDLGLV